MLYVEIYCGLWLHGYTQVVAGGLFGLEERTIRVPYSDHTTYIAYVKDQIVKFIDNARYKVIEVFVTANVILCDPLEREFR